jgi:hypothetical protein
MFSSPSNHFVFVKVFLRLPERASMTHKLRSHLKRLFVHLIFVHLVCIIGTEIIRLKAFICTIDA